MNFIYGNCHQCNMANCKFYFHSPIDNFSKQIYQCQNKKHQIQVFNFNICCSCLHYDTVTLDHPRGESICTRCGVVQPGRVLDDTCYQNQTGNDNYTHQTNKITIDQYITPYEKRLNALWRNLPTEINQNMTLFNIVKTQCKKHQLRDILITGCIVYYIENEFSSLKRNLLTMAQYLQINPKKLIALKTKYINQICHGFNDNHQIIHNNIDQQQQDELFVLCINTMKTTRTEACHILKRFKEIERLPYNHLAIKHCWIGLDGDVYLKYAFCIAEKVGVELTAKHIHMPMERLQEVYDIMKKFLK